MIAFKSTRITFPPTVGVEQIRTVSVNFDQNIRTAEAALKGFNIGYTDRDRSIFKMAVNIEDITVSGNQVSAKVYFLLRDSSGNIDDSYEGEVEVLFMANLVEND